MKERETMSKLKYRQGVAAMVLNNQCQILICQRSNDNQYYQLPQGGIKKGENAKTALLRELKEEIGTNNVEILAKLPDKTCYIWPDKLRYSSKYDGQEHQWYIVRLKDGESLETSKEFSRFRWVPFTQFLEHVSPHRRDSYQKVLDMIQKSNFSIGAMNLAGGKTTGQYFEELVGILRRLRQPNDGCPWDLKQTHESIRPYLIEETYEVVEAIDKKDMAALKEELGDLLLQIVFHSQLEAEAGLFTIDDVLQYLNDKMIRRHPHIFGTIEAKHSDTVLKNWEEIKKNERKGKKRDSILDGIPTSLPALLRARRVQERAQSVGFDWDSIDPAMDKVREEVEEFAEVCQEGIQAKIEDEMGDIFFALVNTARFVNVDPEKALEKTIQKFMKRFRYIERKLAERAIKLSDATLAEMDAIWEEAKE